MAKNRNETNLVGLTIKKSGKFCGKGVTTKSQKQRTFYYPNVITWLSLRMGFDGRM